MYNGKNVNAMKKTNEACSQFHAGHANLSPHVAIGGGLCAIDDSKLFSNQSSVRPNARNVKYNSFWYNANAHVAIVMNRFENVLSANTCKMNGDSCRKGMRHLTATPMAAAGNEVMSSLVSACILLFAALLI